MHSLPPDPLVAKAFTEACAVLARTTIALYETAAGEPKAVGTGFFVSHAGRPFLVSAAHVLKRLQDTHLYFYVAPGTVRRVTGKLTTNSQTGDPNDDLIDIGAVRIEGTGLPPYPAMGISLWSSADIPLGRLATSTALYAFVGYPATKSRVRHHPPQLVVEPQAYLAQSAPLGEYAGQGLSPWSHRYLVFDKKRSRGLRGEGRSFPKPHGVSGSPVFLLHDELASAQGERFELAGVVTTWHPRERRVVATGAALVRGLLDAAA